MKPIVITSDSKPIQKRIGTAQVINEKGEVVSERKNAFTLLGPPPDKCQVCAADHAHDQPHNQESLYYQMAFHAEHGRWPTWTDAMAHCCDEVKLHWRVQLVAAMKKKNLAIPEDLMEEKPHGR